ncbi:ATP-binding protein [Lactococcus hodotermopsidis]|nr:ATP-binding protein [Lactococcus hodotermopsidis]
MINRPLYLKQIIPVIDKDIIKVIVGFRRSGKSILLKLIQDYLLENGRAESQFIKINFEDFFYYDYRDPKQLHDFLKEKIAAINGKAYLFLDEIQEVTGFEQVINSLRVSENVDIYITGSNSNLLSGELATYLAGRYIQFFVYPFSFKEYISAKEELGESKGISDYFLAYIREGGMPFVVTQNLPLQIKENYLKDIYHSVVLKDIIERNSIRDVALLERVIRFALANTGQIFSATSISKYLKSQGRNVKVDTLLNYLKYCVDALLFYPLARNDLKGKKIFQTNAKYYVVDHGLRETLLHDNETEIQMILENIVALEAFRRGYAVTIGYVGDYEIDFVIEKEGQKIYLQVTYLLNASKTIEREFRSLLKLADNYRKIVLSMDLVLQPREGIEHLRVEEFLLREDW